MNWWMANWTLADSWDSNWFNAQEGGGTPPAPADELRQTKFMNDCGKMMNR